LVAHVDATATAPYKYIEDTDRADGYTLLNARLTLQDIPLGQDRNSLQIAAWGKNLTDEEYAVYAFHIGDPVLAVAQAFGDPRMFGVDFTYRYR
jgi:iron complex outermembrane recepter protein